MMKRHDAEINEAIDSDQTGEGFIFDMFDYELSNHEYSYTGDMTDSLCALIQAYKTLSKSVYALRKTRRNVYSFHYYCINYQCN